MEPFPSTVESSMQYKDGSEPRVQINELPPVGSSPFPNSNSNLRRANTVAQGGNLIRRNLELKTTRDRTNTTGLREKNSQDSLRKGPLQRSQTHRTPLAARAAPRKAGHFTVGSVGQNGKIFLRYNHGFISSFRRPFGLLSHILRHHADLYLPWLGQLQTHRREAPK